MKYKLILTLSLISIALFVVLGNHKMKNKVIDSGSYKIINPTEANKLISDKDNVFMSTISFNEASVYQLKNKEHLVTPIIPFFNSLIISNSEFLEQCIKEEKFPMVDTVSKSLFDRVDLNSFSQLQNDLQNKIELRPENTLNLSDVEDKMRISLRENTFKDVRKSFVILLGNLVILKNKQNFSWAYVREIGGLNPVIKLVIFDKQNSTYYPVEDCITKFEKEYKSYKDEASLISNIKIMFDFPKKPKLKHLTVLE